MPGKVWTKAKLLMAIKKLHRQGADLSATGVQKEHSALFSSARSRSHFGSWRAALEAAGLDYNDFKRIKQSWTRDKILEGIRKLHREGEDLLDPAFRTRHRSLYLAACAQRYYGSWRRAVKAAGLDHEKLRENRIWTKRRILRTIQQMGHEGKPLGWAYIEQHKPGIYRAARRKENFGSWADALRAAGLDDHVSRASIQRDQRAQMQLESSEEDAPAAQPESPATEAVAEPNNEVAEAEPTETAPGRTLF